MRGAICRSKKAFSTRPYTIFYYKPKNLSVHKTFRLLVVKVVVIKILVENTKIGLDVNKLKGEDRKENFM